jgi:hypothetical protein
MRSLRLLLLACVICCAPACSFLGLDVIPVEGCATDSDCDGLELVERPADDCHTWQCNPTTSRCEIDVLDADGDGAPAMLSSSMLMCASSGVDCDETDRARFPGNAESCSGTDSDCNGLIDDGAPDLAASASCVAIDTPVESFIAGFSETDGFPVAETLELRGSALIHTRIATDGERSAERTVSGAMPLTRSLLSLVPVRTGEWAVLRTAGACQPFVQRFDSATAALEGPIPDDCNGARLGDLAGDPTQRDRGLMVAFGVGTTSRCTSGTPAPSALSASASVAAFPTSGDYTTAAPADLGETTSSSSPVVVAVGGGVYLVALPRADRRIEVLAITTVGDVASSEVIYTEAARPTQPDLVSLAAGADGEYVLSWSFLCDAGNEARFFSWTESSSATAGALVTTTSGAPLQTTAVFQPRLDEWLLVSASGGALQGRRFDRDAAPIGVQFEIAGQFVGVRVLAQALESTHAYRLFAVRDPITVLPDPEIPDCAALIDVGCLAPLE